MDAAGLRRACLAYAGTFEDDPFGPDTSVFQVRAGAGRARMFALAPRGADRLWVNLKCDPDLAVELRTGHPEITPGWHMSKKHWITLDLTGSLPDDLVAQLIEDSWDLVVEQLPRRDRELLGWARLARGADPPGTYPPGTHPPGTHPPGTHPYRTDPPGADPLVPPTPMR